MISSSLLHAKSTCCSSPALIPELELAWLPIDVERLNERQMIQRCLSRDVTSRLQALNVLMYYLMLSPCSKIWDRVSD